ncbi:hypothetical protein NP493_383g03005 [Ridgeia piscesae]|uniref:Uncharacterized protein n=1 Tax=Ridgeia piscesae TaxID=27915 RepID=A0AAD9L1Q1_RIDPI|nr:hypothetical protein NP493_383g03005 [Ridgeia piscesae]
MNVSTTHMGPMPTVPIQLVPSTVTVTTATSSTTSQHALVCHWMIHDLLVIFIKGVCFLFFCYCTIMCIQYQQNTLYCTNSQNMS